MEQACLFACLLVWACSLVSARNRLQHSLCCSNHGPLPIPHRPPFTACCHHCLLSPCPPRAPCLSPSPPPDCAGRGTRPRLPPLPPRRALRPQVAKHTAGAVRRGGGRCGGLPGARHACLRLRRPPNAPPGCQVGLVCCLPVPQGWHRQDCRRGHGQNYEPGLRDRGGVHAGMVGGGGGSSFSRFPQVQQVVPSPPRSYHTVSKLPLVLPSHATHRAAPLSPLRHPAGPPPRCCGASSAPRRQTSTRTVGPSFPAFFIYRIPALGSLTACPARAARTAAAWASSSCHAMPCCHAVVMLCSLCACRHRALGDLRRAGPRARPSARPAVRRCATLCRAVVGLLWGPARRRCSACDGGQTPLLGSENEDIA